jgi:uncharacterized damage-inducible protein DinB
MLYHLGTQEMEPNHWIAWVLELPGCYSSARMQEEAIAQAAARIADFYAWRAGQGRALPVADGGIETRVVEVARSFFEDDWRPLARDEVEDALWLLDCTRRDLLGVIQPLSSEALNQRISDEGERSIARILNHIAWSEWWYFDRLHMAFNRREMPHAPLDRLDKVRAHTRALLPELAGNSDVIEREGESWSVRKALRRTLWHERDHTQHIAKLVGEHKLMR